jgi:hypothetical protein
MTSLLNFIKIYQLVQKVLGGKHRQTDNGQTDGQTDRQDGDLISLTFLFKDSRLKISKCSHSVRIVAGSQGCYFLQMKNWKNTAHNLVTI